MSLGNTVFQLYCHYYFFIIIIISSSSSISIILALQSLLNLSLFQNCPPLFSVLFKPPVPQAHVLPIFRN